jgi:signal peptidase I
MTDDPSSLRQRAIGWARQLTSIAMRAQRGAGRAHRGRRALSRAVAVDGADLLVGDELIASKFAYGWGKYSSPIGLMPDFSGRLFGQAPERGDVVVFRLPREPSTTYVKRLIGLPGDRIQMRTGRLYINDAMVPRRATGTFDGDAALCRDAAQWARARDHRNLRHRPIRRHAGVRRAGPALLHDGRQPRQLAGQPRPPAEGGVGFVPEENLVAAPTGCCSRTTRRSAGSTLPTGRMPSVWRACSAASIATRASDDRWRFGAASEADFEPLLALRIEVMREHLERVFRYEPRARGASFASISTSPACA